MSYKLVKYLNDDFVKVLNPTYIAKIYHGDYLLDEYGAYIVLRDDLFKCACRCVKQNKLQPGKCTVVLEQDLKEIASFSLKEDKLKPI